MISYLSPGALVLPSVNCISLLVLSLVLVQLCVTCVFFADLFRDNLKLKHWKWVVSLWNKMIVQVTQMLMCESSFCNNCTRSCTTILFLFLILFRYFFKSRTVEPAEGTDFWYWWCSKKTLKAEPYKILHHLVVLSSLFTLALVF